MIPMAKQKCRPELNLQPAERKGPSETLNEPPEGQVYWRLTVTYNVQGHMAMMYCVNSPMSAQNRDGCNLLAT